MYRSIEHKQVRLNNDVHLCVTIRVLIPVLHVSHDAKRFMPSVYSHFIDNYPTTLFYHKNANVWVV